MSSSYETLKASPADQPPTPPIVREPEVYRDPALLLLLEAVRIRASEGADQRRFSVIDVASGSNDEGFHPASCQSKDRSVA